MNFNISHEAAQWYKKELEIANDTKLRLFVRYGEGGAIPGFSLGIRIDEPQNIFKEAEVAGIHFYIENSDAWYFENNDLTIEFDQTSKEPKFIYV